MGVLQFYNKEELFTAFKNQSKLALSKLYYSKNNKLQNGTAVFLDKFLTQKLVANRWYGLKNYKGSNWAFQVNSLSQVVNLQEDAQIKIGWQRMYPFSDVTATKAEMTAAAGKGASLFQLNIRMTDVYANNTQFTNKTGDWSKPDQIIAHAASLPFDEVYIRIISDFDDDFYYDLTQSPVVPKTDPLFNLFTDLAQDEWYNPGRINAGSGHGSLAVEAVVDKMVAFFDHVCERYAPILGEKLKYGTSATSAQQEMGGNYENQYYPSSSDPLSAKHRVCFDYHPASIAIFQDFVIKQHGTLTGAGQAHGKVYNNKTDIQPPKTGKANLTSVTEDDIYNLFKTQLGLDWYLHNYLMMRSFWLKCKEKLKIRAPWAQFIGEFGSNTDELNIVRYCYDLIDISGYCDVIKTQFSGIDWFGNASIAAAVVANNVGSKPIWVEMNENDPVEQARITDAAQVKAALFNNAKSAVANGARMIIFIGNSSSPYYNNTIDLIGELKTWATNNPDYRTTDGTTVQIPISKFIQNYDGAVADIYNAGLSTALTNRPIVKLIQNVLSHAS